MDTLTRRCPFLTVVPSTVLHSAGQSSLVGYALKCPVMMELASRPRVRELSSSASVASETSPKEPGQLCFKEELNRTVENYSLSNSYRGSGFFYLLSCVKLIHLF